MFLADVDVTGDAFEEFMRETGRPYSAGSFRAQGRALAVGVSCLPLDTIRRAMAHPNAVLVDVGLTYSHHTLVDDTLADVKPLLDANGVTLIDASPLAMGLLTTSGPQPWHPASSQLKAACAKQAACDSSPRLEEVALAYACRTPIGASVLVGCRTLVEFRANANVAYQCRMPNIIVPVAWASSLHTTPTDEARIRDHLLDLN